MSYRESYEILSSRSLRLMLTYEQTAPGDKSRFQIVRDILDYRKQVGLTRRFRIKRNRYIDKPF